VTTGADPFRLDFELRMPAARAASTLLRPLLERALALGTYRNIYRDELPAAGGPFASRALRALRITSSMPAGDFDNVPQSGAVIVAANHPHGMLDGLLLLDAVHRVRPDVRVLTNHLLSGFPDLPESCFFVDPFDGPGSAARSRAGLRAAHLWLRRGGVLIVFPAGEVAHGPRIHGVHQDGSWNTTVGRLAIATRAQVVPAFIEGANSRTFYAAGRVHPALRTLLLARELLKKRGTTIPMRFGHRLTFTECACERHDVTMAARAAVEQLAVTCDSPRREMRTADRWRLRWSH
jgi:putative hemolysin